MNEPQAAARAATHPAQERSRTGAETPFQAQREFLRGFVRHPRQVGSVIPSSRRLESRIVRAAGLADAQCVVELGPGTGGTTQALLHAMSPSARLLAVELETAFHAHIARKIHDTRLSLELGSAEDIEQFLHDRRMPQADVVVSGIPFSTMPADVATRIAQAISRALRPGGRFVAYQLRADVARYTTPFLGTPDFDWEFLNIPPMRVYRWVKQSQTPSF